MSEWYSLLECAKILGTTKNAIKYRVNKLDLSDKKQENGQWFVSAKALDKMKQVSSANSSEQEQKKSERESVERDMLIDSLNSQIEFLKEQIRIKDEQIRTSQILLANEQGKVLQITDKQSWWSRTFGKKKTESDLEQ